MEAICSICGAEHSLLIGDNVWSYFMTRSKTFLFDKFKRLRDIEFEPAPLCGSCTRDFNRFLKTFAPVIAAQYLSFVAEKSSRSIKIKMGLAKRKGEGIKLGRPRTINESLILEYASRGLSIRQIAKCLKYSRSGISKTLQRANN